ncbi:muscular LMNA-interacting protein isoform X8 [Monodelphis domestica]|uniref:muscular LMNA-interacting protein isoform X8 n=1 Tax=Monodelphis domestica TaxID=13616 RepID=UPI0024E237BB|nr:muscular LMNA-interacting protein isoform X8 [Monodelphis domestica]
MDRGNHKKTDSVNKTLKEEKLTVFSGDSETKPLIFTFVPTIRRLPTHSQVADATKYLVKIGEEPRDKSHGAINRSNSNEFLDCVTLKSGIQQESDIQTYACSTETSPKIIQGRGLKLNQPETMQQSDLFKAEYVFIVDSEGEEEATGRKEDKQPTVGNGHGLARPKSLALAPGPITTLQKPHQGDFQGPPQSDLPQDAASPQKQIQLTSSPSTTSDQLSCKPPALFVSPTNLKAQSDMVSLHQASILEEFHTRRVDPRGSSMQETSTYFQRTTHSSPCFAPAEVTLEQKSTQILDSKQLKNMSSPTLAHQKAGLWSETLNKNSTSPSHFISSSGSQSFTAEVPGSSAPKSDASSYIPVRIITHSLSPSPKPLNPTFYGSSSTLCSQASSSGNLAKSGAKSPVPTRLSLLTAILKSNPPHGRPFSPVSCPTFSSNSLTSSTLTLDQRVKRTPPTPKKSYSSFSLKEESPDLGEHQPTDISQQSVHSPLFTKIASQEASLSYKKPLSSSPLTPQLEKAPPSPVSPKRTMIPPQLQSKILNSSILPPIPPCSSAVSFKKGNHDADPKGLAPEKSKRVHTYSSTSSSSVFVSDTASQGNILPFPKEYLSPTSPFYPTCQSQVASSQLLSKEKNFVSAITPSISIPSSLSHSSLGSSIPLIDNIHSHTIHSISSLHPNDQFSTLPIRPAKSPEATVMHTRSPVSSTAPPMSLTRAKESTSTQSLSLPSDPENKKTKQYKIKSSYKAFAAIPTNTLLLEQKMPVTVPRAAGRETKYANLTSPSSTMAVSQLTKPGVIRPVPAKSKIILRKEEEETYEPNPFSKYLEDTSGLFAGQDVTSLHDATPLHPLYKTKPFPPAKSLLYPQNLSYTDCLTPGPFSHLSSVSLGDGHVNSPTSFSHNRLYNKPSHPIVTIPENEALDSKEVLQHKLRELHESGAAVQAGPLDFSLHDLNPGDKVYIKNFKRTGATQPSWEGPFQILLTTPTSIKIGERDSWIHCSHVKKASSAETD